MAVFYSFKPRNAAELGSTRLSKQAGKQAGKQASKRAASVKGKARKKLFSLLVGWKSKGICHHPHRLAFSTTVERWELGINFQEESAEEEREGKRRREREGEEERKGLSAYYCPFEFDSIRFDFEFVKSVNWLAKTSSFDTIFSLDFSN